MTSKRIHILAIEREYLTEKELSELTGLSPSWFQQQRHKHTGPDYLKFGDSKYAPIRYRVSDIEKWMTERKIGTSEADDV